jgi:succinyl-CoA synthetase alpha subunit/citrate synthase
MSNKEWYTLFDKNTRAIVYGQQFGAVQRMLDFDYICGREKTSVAAIIVPTANNSLQKFYWGTSEILLPVYYNLSEALEHFPEVDVLVNFASFRSAHSATMEALQYPQFRTIAIIAEGMPERRTRMIIAEANKRGVTIIGPATVGGIKPGCFKIGNTGGMLDNIISAKLYRPGSVAFVSRSGGLSNELNNIIARNADGVYEGVAIGGDRYPGTTYIDHLLRYEADPDVKMIVMLGEVGGTDEYAVCKALHEGRITKPLVAWCIGTCAKVFPAEVQFGHAGALASGDMETADAKNSALREAGAVVPASFEEFGQAIHQTYTRLVEQGSIVEKPEPEPPKVPMDFTWAQRMGLIRRSSNFISTICDDRGEELNYAGMPISQVFNEDVGIGGVVSLLWFKRLLPTYARKFIEMVIMLTADRDPQASGATNTIITARAGRDLVSALTSGILTIGPKVGGAIDGAAQIFAWAYDQGLTPQGFVHEMRERGQLIMGIGHCTYSVENPDIRVTIMKEYAKKHLPKTEILDYALEVEQVMLEKKSNLMLNADGCIAVIFLDLLRSSGAFAREEADEYIHMGCLNGLFVLGRSIDFIGRFIDLKLLKSVAFVCKSRELSNELSRVISRNSDGVYEWAVVGGERYPDSTFLDHLLRYEENPDVKMIVMVGDIDGVEEYEVSGALRGKLITKPIVAWCSSGHIRAVPSVTQVGHAALLDQGGNSANPKNEALKKAGAVVPETFRKLGESINQTYKKLVDNGIIARELDLNPEPELASASRRDKQLLYEGMPISHIFEQNIGIGGVLGLLWFKRLLPNYARHYIEMVLMVTADHGPAVSGAHNTIVSSRAEKDLISALASGLLTIGPRFGGAIDGAAQIFSWAYDQGLPPQDFVDEMKRRGQLIMGIGHRVKSVHNPDMRVTIMKEYAKANFKSTALLDYALAVEKVTTHKRSTLILNVDGCIAVAMVDLLRSCGAFTREEADEYIQIGCLNGLFILGRSMGFIGHFIDQKRLQQGLYRHPWDDIAYMLPDKVQRYEEATNGDSRVVGSEERG